MFENVQNIRKNPKLYEECHGKLANVINSRRWNFSWNQNPGRLLSSFPTTAIHYDTTQLLSKSTVDNKLSKSQEKITQIIYMDDIKLLAKNENKLETLIQTIRIYSQDIWMEDSRENVQCL